MTYRPRHRCLLLALMLIASGCVMSEPQERLAHYINQEVLAIAHIESVALDRYAAVTGANFTTVEALTDALDREVIPVYERFYTLIKTIQPSDHELAAAHAFYVRGAGEILDGFRMKRYGLSVDQVYLIEQGNTQINEGIDQTLSWKTQIEQLALDRGLYTASQKKSKWLETLESIVESIQNARI